MGTYTGTPYTWPVGHKVLAAELNAELRDPLNALSSAYTAYTPTIGGFTLGNGTVFGRYNRVGKDIHGYVEFVFGSTSAAATAFVTATLPVSGLAGTAVGVVGHFYDASASALYVGAPYLSSTLAGMGVLGTNGLRGTPTTTSPFTWATGDYVRWWFSYEAA